MESIDKLRDLAADINGNEIIDHMQLYPSCVFDGAWLDSWHHAFDRELEALEREIAERYMELPVDADGVPIHPGNYVLLDGKGGEVWLVGCRDVMCSDGMSYTASALNRVKPDPVKELLEEFAAAIKIRDGFNDATNDVITEYAARIREAVER